jgi:hypothetical protein
VVVLWFGEPSNLHSVWDSGLILRSELSSPELAEKADVATAEEAKAWAASSPLEWAAESSALLDKVYSLGDRRLSFRYVFEEWPTVEKRIAQAGVRLAVLLDRLLGPQHGNAGLWLPR